jgi:hypothetical protein
MYKATLQLNSNGFGRYQLGMKTEVSLQIVIYGNDPAEIRREAGYQLDQVIGYPYEEGSDAFKEDFRKLPAMLKEKLGQQSASFDLPYDPYEFPPGASWAISKHSGDEIVIVLQ